jgi:hypothetical protein
MTGVTGNPPKTLIHMRTCAHASARTHAHARIYTAHFLTSLSFPVISLSFFKGSCHLAEY